MDSKDLLKLPSVRRTPLGEKLREGKVRCGVCERRCVILEGGRGFCGTRTNIEGDLYTLTYGDISSVSANPIEKKPFYHFHPGSYALTIGSWSCNFTCPWCQNYSISKLQPDPERASYLEPQAFVEETLRLKCQGTSISFNEPTLLFEYSLDVFPLAKHKGLYNTFVSNGYMTLEALQMLKDVGMDAVNIDVKGGREAVQRYCGADVTHVWRNIEASVKLGLHVEVVVLLIPGVNDDEEDIREIVKLHLKMAGGLTPIHFTRFYPAYRMTDRPPTPVETLEAAYKIARQEGLSYVYVGNVPGHRLEDTYCHSCGFKVIKREGFTVLQYNLSADKKCPKCGARIPIVG